MVTKRIFDLDISTLSDPKIQVDYTRIHRQLAWCWESVCTKLQVDSSCSFCVILQKATLTFVSSVTLEIKVTTPKSTGILKGHMGMHYTKFQVDTNKTAWDIAWHGCVTFSCSSCISGAMSKILFPKSNVFHRIQMSKFLQCLSSFSKIPQNVSKLSALHPKRSNYSITLDGGYL